MNSNRRLWIGLGALLAVSFSVLLWVGTEIHRVMPPIPAQVVSERGETLYTRADIETGRQVWQSMGGMQLGSIWGHGSYVAPDWTADWLHREAIGDARPLGAARCRASTSTSSARTERRPRCRGALTPAIRRNTYDAATGTITVSRRSRRCDPRRRRALQLAVRRRSRRCRAARSVRDEERHGAGRCRHRRALTAFFWWTAWAATTERPGGSSHLHQQLAARAAGRQHAAAAPVHVVGVQRDVPDRRHRAARLAPRAPQAIEAPPTLPATDPLAMMRVTPSMRATAKYFWLVHRAVPGADPARRDHRALPGRRPGGSTASRSPTSCPIRSRRTWHTQLAVFWIATAWLGTACTSARRSPATSRSSSASASTSSSVCLLIIVVGSFAGQWLAVMQKLGLATAISGSATRARSTSTSAASGRSSCSSGSALARAGRPRAVAGPDAAAESRSRSSRCCSCPPCAIGLFYGAGLMWGEHTHLSMVEYWRWWVVHLWVEGFFEVFATAVIAFLFTRLGLLRAQQRDRRRAVRDHRLPGRRRARHTAPPVFHGHADRGDRARRELLARSRWCRWRSSASRRYQIWDLQARAGDAVDGSATAGRSCSSSRWRSGTWSAPGCSAS